MPMSSRLTAAPRAVKIGYTCAKFGAGTSPSKRSASPSPASPQGAAHETRRDSDDGELPSAHFPSQPHDQGEETYDDEVDGTENGNLV